MSPGLKHRSAQAIKRLSRALSLFEQGLSEGDFIAKANSQDPRERAEALGVERAFEIAINDLISLAREAAQTLEETELQHYEGREAKSRKDAPQDIRVLVRGGMLPRELGDSLQELIGLRNKLQHDYVSVRALEEYHRRIEELPGVARAFAKEYLIWLQTGKLEYVEGPEKKVLPYRRPHNKVEPRPINPTLRLSLLPASISMHLNEVRDALQTLTVAREASDQGSDLARLGAERSFEIAVNDFAELAREGLLLLGEEVTFNGQASPAPVAVDRLRDAKVLPPDVHKAIRAWISFRNKLQHSYEYVEREPELFDKASTHLMQHSTEALVCYRDFLTTQIELPRPRLSKLDDLAPTKDDGARAGQIGY